MSRFKVDKRFNCITFIFRAICLKEQDHLGDNLHVCLATGRRKMMTWTIQLRNTGGQTVHKVIYFVQKISSKAYLKYGFCKKSLRKNKTLTSCPFFFIFSITFGWVCCCNHPKVIKKRKKRATGKSFIFPKWLLTKSIL